MPDSIEFPFLSLAELVNPQELPPEGNMANRVHGLLRKLIVEVKLLPGRPLSEKEIASLLHVSKTPVREAIIRLSEEGFVTVVPQGGTYISPILVQRYMEACFIRFRLEEGAVIEATKRHSLEDIVRLKTCLAEQRKAAQDENYADFFLLDEEFHRTIFNAARLPGAWSVVNQAKGEMDRMRHLKRVFAVRRTEKVIEDHEAIVNAIESGDISKAQEAIQNHLGSLETKIEELSNNPKIWTFIEQVNTRITKKRVSRGAKAPD